MIEPYNPRVREFFAEPAHAGQLADAITVTNSDQGIRVELSILAVDGHIRQMRFRAWGCPHSLAACEAVCAELEGAPEGLLAEYAVAGLMQSLAVPAEKSARILVIEDTVRQLWVALRASDTPKEQD